LTVMKRKTWTSASVARYVAHPYTKFACIADLSQRSTKAPPKKKVKKGPKPKKVKPFRFLDLPPELRDMIYEMALVEPNDVSIVARTRAHRQKPLRGPVYNDSDHRVTGWGRSRTIHHGTDQLSPISTTFTPALLAVNKQINAEAINYLYGHEFIFENCTALAEFLVAIGHRNQQRLDTVRVVSWGSGSSASNAANRYGLTILAGATNLTALILDCAIGGSSPDKMAALLYRDGHHFIRAYGIANGSKDAVVDIIELHDKNFRVYHNKQPSEQEQRESFEKTLRAFSKTL
jgi:hypothetical protein